MEVFQHVETIMADAGIDITEMRVDGGATANEPSCGEPDAEWHREDPVIPVGDSMSAFMKDLGLKVTGGKQGTVGRFKDQLNRLACLVVVMKVL